MYHKCRSYDIWFLKFKVRQTEIFVILGQFLPFQPPDNPENQIFKIKKIPGDIIILQICTINGNLLMYGSWDMECDRQNCQYGPFLPFYPLWTQKIKILKKWKKYLKILSFYKHKWQSYDAWFLRYGVQRTEFFVILDCFLPFYPLTTWIEDFEKKKCLEILSFYTSVPKIKIICCTVP